MKRFPYIFLALLVAFSIACKLLTPATSTPQAVHSTQPALDSSSSETSALVNIYDPARNPADDLQQAIVLAQKENKHIMLELGGNWCIWCKYMDEFYANHPDILKLRAENYVLVKVNYSEENTNDGFLSQFPSAPGYPHIYILDSDGTLLHSQDTAELEDGKSSYVPEVFIAFLEKWAPNK
ncbi:MAG: thioredoxin family protein [Anaerolineales bacterium]